MKIYKTWWALLGNQSLPVYQKHLPLRETGNLDANLPNIAQSFIIICTKDFLKSILACRDTKHKQKKHFLNLLICFNYSLEVV